MIRTTDFKNKVALSASRIDTYLNCSALYAAKYLYKLPDLGNSGSSRGSVCHDIFEILANKKHKNRVENLVKEDSCVNDYALWRLINAYAKKYNVQDEANLKLIDKFIITGLNTEFYGPNNTVEMLVEKDFDFEYENGPISIRLKGFIDCIFLIKKGDTLVVSLRDYKSSKDYFDKQKIATNHQARFYQIAITKFLFPEFKLEEFKFVFLKFRDDPIQEAVLIDDNELFGYMIWLTHIQYQMNTFKDSDASNNFAAVSKATSWLCGREGVKKDGTTMFLCGCRKPLKYFVVKKDGVIIKSSFTSNIKLDEGEKIEEANYSGCSFYYDRNGKKRGRSFD